jgi:adenosine deaminase
VLGRDLRSLPKAELHLHLHGAMRASTLVELSMAAGLTAPDPRAFADFDGFQVIYRAARACVTRPEYLRRLIGEVVEDAAADGVVWVQPHFDPFAYPEFGPAAQVLELALTAGWEAGVRHGVGFGLTLAAMRHHGPDAAVDLARFAGRHAGRGVHAFGLAGNEAVFPIEPFAAAFAIARDAGLTAAPHAGEMAGPGSVLLDAGVACTLGADDPLLFGTGLLGEYEAARTCLGLTDEQLAALARTSITTSDAPAELIASATQRLDDWLTDPPADPHAGP